MKYGSECRMRVDNGSFFLVSKPSRYAGLKTLMAIRAHGCQHYLAPSWLETVPLFIRKIRVAQALANSSS